MPGTRNKKIVSQNESSHRGVDWLSDTQFLDVKSAF